MRRPSHSEDARLWALVTATVRPAKSRTAAVAPEAAGPVAEAKAAKPASSDFHRGPMHVPPTPHAPHRPHHHHGAPDPIEPRRKRRIVRDREPIGARLDLHGMDQDSARAAVHGFIRRAHDDGVRAVIIITGKGALGDGILRRRTPDWLSEPAVRPMIAGLSQAERHHGGEGALYVALKRAHRH